MVIIIDYRGDIWLTLVFILFGDKGIGWAILAIIFHSCFILKISIHFHLLSDNTFFKKITPFSLQKLKYIDVSTHQYWKLSFPMKRSNNDNSTKESIFCVWMSSIHFQSFNMSNNVRDILGEKEGSNDSNHTKKWAKRISYWDFVRTNQMDYW